METIMNQLFGTPYYKSKINSILYNKYEIINAIENNYRLDSSRNSWDGHDVYSSNVHQSVNDFDNTKFDSINFEKLLPLYNEKINEFFSQLKLKKSISYKYQIVNYTCMKSTQFLKEHTHDCEFAAVHYIKFNPVKHLPTFYVNDSGYCNYLAQVIPKLTSVLDPTNIENSWASKYFYMTVEEDDFVIVPGVVPHFVPPSHSDELRITIVVNIKIDYVDDGN